MMRFPEIDSVLRENLERGVAEVLKRRIDPDEIHDMSQMWFPPAGFAPDSDWARCHELGPYLRREWESALRDAPPTREARFALGFPSAILDWPPERLEQLVRRLGDDTDSGGKQMLDWDHIAEVLLGVVLDPPTRSRA